MNKAKLLQKIVERLEADMALYCKAARASHAEATHESSKAENKYDTRGLEAAYLAGAQARQAVEMQAAIGDLKQVELKKFRATDPIDVTALVSLESEGETNHYFIAPRAGGLEVKMGKNEVVVLNPHSPLGRQLMGRKAGDKVKLQPGPRTPQLLIAKVT